MKTLNRMPVNGDIIRAIEDDSLIMIVDHVENNICYETPNNSDSKKCFIAYFSSDNEFNNRVYIEA